MKNCEVYTALEGLINGVKKASPRLLETSDILRKRKECPGREAFNTAITILDAALLDAVKIHQKYGGKNAE